MKQNENFYHYVVNERKYDGTITYIFDGERYRTFVKSLPLQERSTYLTCILNTDGALRFESSSYSIWPVYLIVNELQVQIRLNNAILCGIWFGKNKPPMHTFLTPLTTMLNTLSSEGIKCDIKNETYCLKLYVLIASVDS